MATDRTLIQRAINEIKPRDVLFYAPVPEAKTLTVLDGNSLKVQAEFYVWSRNLVWEEWLDVRRAWAANYHAVVCECVRGDLNKIELTTKLALSNGEHYLLLEYIKC